MFAPHLKALSRYGIKAPDAFALDSIYRPSDAGVFTSVARVSQAIPTIPTTSHGQPGTISLPQADLLFSLNVGIGTPQQSFLLELDTGSPLTWVFGTDIPKKQQRSHSLFDSSKSTSYVGTPENYTLTYQDGSYTNGTRAFDVVSFGGIELPDTAIGVARDVSPMYATGTVDGIFGLKLGSDVLKSLGRSKMLEKPVFTLKLVQEGPGEIVFGLVDTTFASSPIHYVQVSSGARKGWRFVTGGIKVDGRLISQRDTSFKEAVIDAGTALVYLRPAVIKAIYEAIPGARFDKFQQGYLVPAGSLYPSVTISVGGDEYEIPSGRPDKHYHLGHGTFFGQYQSTSEDDTTEYLGAVFLKNVLAVHDFENNRIGFARRNDVKYEAKISRQ